MKIASFMLILLVIASVFPAYAQDKLNIVVIMTDNQGFGELGA